MFIFFPRELSGDCKRRLHLNEVFTYNSFKKFGVIPWFAQWNEELLFKRKYYSISILPSDFKFSIANEKVFKYEMRGNFIGTIDKKRSMSSNLKDLVSVDEELEIYSQCLDLDMPEVWGPPEHIYDLSLKEIFDNRRFSISTEKNDLYIIHKL